MAQSRWRGTLVGTIGLVLVATLVGRAADIEQTSATTESRRQAAENGLRQIKQKSPTQAEQVRAQYTEAATRNNAWLDTLCEAVQKNASAAPDVTASVQAAADALVAWVKVRNPALGMANVERPQVDVVKRVVVQHLTEITNTVWKNNRQADDAKRVKVAATLKDRLRWKSWDEVQ